MKVEWDSVQVHEYQQTEGHQVKDTYDQGFLSLLALPPVIFA